MFDVVRFMTIPPVVV